MLKNKKLLIGLILIVIIAVGGFFSRTAIVGLFTDKTATDKTTTDKTTAQEDTKELKIPVADVQGREKILTRVLNGDTSSNVKEVIDILTSDLMTAFKGGQYKLTLNGKQEMMIWLEPFHAPTEAGGGSVVPIQSLGNNNYKVNALFTLVADPATGIEFLQKCESITIWLNVNYRDHAFYYTHDSDNKYNFALGIAEGLYYRLYNLPFTDDMSWILDLKKSDDNNYHVDVKYLGHSGHLTMDISFDGKYVNVTNLVKE